MTRWLPKAAAPVLERFLQTDLTRGWLESWELGRNRYLSVRASESSAVGASRVSGARGHDTTCTLAIDGFEGAGSYPQKLLFGWEAMDRTTDL